MLYSSEDIRFGFVSFEEGSGTIAERGYVGEERSQAFVIIVVMFGLNVADVFAGRSI